MDKGEQSKKQRRGQPGNPGQFASNPYRQAEAVEEDTITYWKLWCGSWQCDWEITRDSFEEVQKEAEQHKSPPVKHKAFWDTQAAGEKSGKFWKLYCTNWECGWETVRSTFEGAQEAVYQHNLLPPTYHTDEWDKVVL